MNWNIKSMLFIVDPNPCTINDLTERSVMKKMKLTFKFSSDKKHSARYDCQEPKMAIYIPFEVLNVVRGSLDRVPLELTITIEATP